MTVQTLENADLPSEAGTQTKAPKPTPELGLMLDLETGGTGPNSVVTQCAIIAFDLTDPENRLRTIDEYLPIQPQIELGRRIDADTMFWWMDQEDAAKNRLRMSGGNDMVELEALTRGIVRKFNQITQDNSIPYELWCRGPHFDVTILSTLLVDCGQEIPWRYDTPRDLRTLMALAGLSTSEVSKSGLTPHVAVDDCKFQIRCYTEAMKRLRARN